MRRFRRGLGRAVFRVVATTMLAATTVVFTASSMAPVDFGQALPPGTGSTAGGAAVGVATGAGPTSTGSTWSGDEEIAAGTGVTGTGVAKAGAAGSMAMAKVKEGSKRKSSPFVRAVGDHFMLDNKPFYFAGTNCYYLDYDSNKMIDDVLTKAKKMGLKVVRMWGFMDGQSQNGVSLQPQLGVYDPTGFRRIDYADAEAKKLGLKLVIVLVNNWTDFGGMDQYVKWVEGSSGSHEDFYTNPKIIKAYENYAKHLIDRRNSITGVLYKNDPTIMTWELANEPRDTSDPSGATITNWARTVSAYIHGLDPNHMIALGDEGWFGQESVLKGYANPYNSSEGVDWAAILKLPYISYGTYHLYPENWGQSASFGNQWIAQHIKLARSLHKPAVLEEFGDSDLSGRDGIYQSWTNTVVKNRGAGDQFWMLSGIMDNGKPYPNYDGYAVYYPSQTARVLAYHAALMNALSNGSKGAKASNGLNPVGLKAGRLTPFSQMKPANGAQNVSASPTLVWGPSLGATGYDLVVSKNKDLSDPVVNVKNLQRTDYVLPTPLANQTTYYWKVVARRNGALGGDSGGAKVNGAGRASAGLSVAAQNASESFTTANPPRSLLMVENFDEYSSNAALTSAWTVNSGGDPLSISLSSSYKNDGTNSLKVDYTVGSKGYSGVYSAIKDANWSGYAGIEFWLKPDGTGRSVNIQFEQGNGGYWQASYTPSSTTGAGGTGGVGGGSSVMAPRLVKIPFTDFVWQSWSAKGPMNVADIKQLGIYFGGSKGSGTMYFDSFAVYPGK